MAREFTEEDAVLLAELGIEDEAEKSAARALREERIIAGFDEIQRFHEMHGRAPRHGEDCDIFERLYAARLDRMGELEDGRQLVEPLDRAGLLAGAAQASVADAGDPDDEALLAELEGEAEASPITQLRHVRSAVDKRAAEDIASRRRCEDFNAFKPLFEIVQQELANGRRQTRIFERKAEIEPGRFFIVGGQKAYVAQMGETFSNEKGHIDARLRVIFDNGTESNMLMRSLQRALHKDEAGRRITEPTAGPLFSDHPIDGETASGLIYVLRSLSDHPLVAGNRKLVHKIGVTNTSIEKRIARASLEPTFLMAEVEVIATYQLYNINRTRLENLIHRVFGPARLEIEIKDRFGEQVIPREWFLVPLFVIEEAIKRIKDETIHDYVYDPQQARLVKA